MASSEPEETEDGNLDYMKCDRCGGDSKPAHECPLKVEQDNHELCNCCEECTTQCGMDR